MTPAPGADDRVLVVEDQTDLRETLAMILEGEGYRVETAANGREALHCLRECPSACLILLDLMMPVMNGWEFREEQCRDPLLAAIPVIVVSAVSNSADKLAALNVVDRLNKPVSPDALLAMVERYCPLGGDRSRPGQSQEPI